MPLQGNSDSDRGCVFPVGFTLRDHTIYVFPPPRWLLIRWYQKLRNNNSIFLLKANLPSYLQSSRSIVLLYIVQMQQWWKEVGGAQHQGWLQKCSAFFPSQANTRLPTLLRWAYSLCPVRMHPPWCLSRTVPSSKSFSFQLCQNYWGGWPQKFRMQRQRHQQTVQALQKCIGKKWPNHQSECSGLKWTLQKCISETDTCFLWNTLQSTLQSEKALQLQY